MLAPTIKSIKRRITSVNSSKNIMKAMNLVASANLQKVKGQLSLIRPMAQNMRFVMDGVKSSESAGESAFTEERDVRNIAYVVFASDRGLCGPYNVNIAKRAWALIEERPGVQEKIISVGTKGAEYFQRRGKRVYRRYTNLSESEAYHRAEEIGNLLASMFKSGEADEVYLAYTRFVTVLSHEPHVEKLLPIAVGAHGESGPMTYDTDVNTFMEYAVPMYLNAAIYGAIIESSVCEHASRMTSMESATQNASEIIDELTLAYNHKRQGAITQEITEIVSGANALR